MYFTYVFLVLNVLVNTLLLVSKYTLHFAVDVYDPKLFGGRAQTNSEYLSDCLPGAVAWSIACPLRKREASRMTLAFGTYFREKKNLLFR